MKLNIQMTSGEVAQLTKGQIIGSDIILINNITSIQNSKQGDLTFFAYKEYEKFVDNCFASCILIPRGYINVPKAEQAYVECENPYFAMVSILKHIVAQNPNIKKSEVHRSAIIGTTSKIPKNVRIGARCVIGENCVIADNVTLHPNVILYDNVIIGENTEIHSNVVCYSDTIIGKRCTIHSGAIIGSDGFGYIELGNSKYDKIPQLGNVIIGDDVEIGANTTIDCAFMDATIIENGVKIDNLVHIAHNCIIKEDTAMAAQAGIAGSSIIGNRNRIGGQVGIAGHIELGDDVIITAQSGVSKSIAEKGIYFGSPAKERLQAFKIEAYLRRLPEIAVDVEMLKKHLLKLDNGEDSINIE
jgi:UDP-3-O-[3-hydroxymyristoyl] glucosamine N-acyltransferase